MVSSRLNPDNHRVSLENKAKQQHRQVLGVRDGALTHATNPLSQLWKKCSLKMERRGRESREKKGRGRRKMERETERQRHYGPQ